MSDLGTARGKVVIDPSGAVTGFGTAEKASESFTQKIKGAGKEARGIGLAVGGSGVAIAAGLGLAVKSAADFEERISAIGAVSGASEKQLEGVRKKALQLGADTKFSAGEAASAIEELVKAGVPLADVMNGAADATVNLAAAGEIDLVEAASIASAALNTFGLHGKDMAHVADQIAGAANASAIDVHQFGESMNQAGAAASLVGLSFEDLTLGITAMGNAGIKGSDAGTSLKTFLLNLQPVTVKQTKLMKKLGLITADGGNQFFTAAGKVKSLRDISETLKNALADMTQQQKIATLETLFGSDAIRAAAIISKEGAAGFDGLAKSVDKVKAADVAAKRMDNLKGSLEQLKGSLETAAIIVGTPFLKGLRGLANAFTGLINKFSELSPKTIELIGKSLAIAAVVLILIGGISFLVGIVQSVVVAFTALGAVIGISGAAMFFWVIAIAAIVAGLVLLFQHNEKFRATVLATWEWIKANVIPVAKDLAARAAEIGQAFAHWFMDVAVPAINNFVTKVIEIGTAIVHWFQDVAIPAVQRFVGFITGTVVPAITRFASAVKEKIGEAFNWLQENVFPVFTSFGELIVAVVQKIIQVIVILEPLWRAVWSVIQTVISIAINFIIDVVQTFITIFKSAWSLLGDNVVDIVVFAFNFVKSFIEIALRTVQGIIQLVTGIITGDWGKAWDGIKNIFGAVWEFIKLIVLGAIQAVGLIIGTGLDLIALAWNAAWALVGLVLRTAWSLIKGVISGALDLIKGLIGSALNLIKAIWNNAWGAMQKTVTSIAGAIVSFVAGLPHRLQSALSTAGSALVDRGAAFMNGLKNGVVNAAGAVASFFRGLPGKIVGWLGDVGHLLFNAGKKIVGGLISGLKSAAGGVKDAVGGLLKSAGGLLPGSPVKEGPLKVLNRGYAGKQIVKMLVAGINTEGASLTKALGGVLGTIRPPASSLPAQVAQLSPRQTAESNRAAAAAAKPALVLHIENFRIEANTPAEGRAAGKAFLGVLEERQILTDARIV